MKRLFCLAMTALLVLMGTSFAEAGPPTLTRIDALPEAGWQACAAFPDWKDYIDDTLAMNSTFSFRGYHGQGTLWLEVAEGVEDFTLYVNGTRFDTAGATGGVYALDISGAAVDGVNTLQVSNIRPAGAEKAVTAYIGYPEVLEMDRGAEGIHPETLKLISDIVENDIAHGFTSAQMAVVKNGRLVYENAWGNVNSYAPDGARITDAAPVTADTLYDLASVTKMFSVSYAVQKLVTDGLLDVDTPIVDILGDAFVENTLELVYAGDESPADLDTQKAWKRGVTVRDILCHEAGFPGAANYNDPDFDLAAQKRGTAGCNVLYVLGREATREAIFKTPLQYAPHSKTLYSGVDYMLAGLIVEKVTGKGLDQYMKETFFDPMDLKHITFKPLENGFVPDDCAATELNGNTRDLHVDYPGIRTGTIQGEVHDERAFYNMEGVSGHAGLFASATDLAKLASVMLTGGYGEHRFFSRNVMDVFTAPKALAFGQWGLGWQRQGDLQRPWYFGTQAGTDAVGHQGWTGTLVMVDPSRELVMVYLTNKINSPVVSEENLNKFAGNCFTASTLGFAAQLLSVGMDEDRDVSGQLLDLLADMAVESVRLMDGREPTYADNALSKLELLKGRAEAAGNPEYVALAEELMEQIG